MQFRVQGGTAHCGDLGFRVGQRGEACSIWGFRQQFRNEFESKVKRSECDMDFRV